MHDCGLLPTVERHERVHTLHRKYSEKSSARIVHPRVDNLPLQLGRSYMTMTTCNV